MRAYIIWTKIVCLLVCVAKKFDLPKQQHCTMKVKDNLRGFLKDISQAQCLYVLVLRMYK
jgi:hypothetical protein